MSEFLGWMLKKGKKIDDRDPKGHRKSTAANYIKRITRILPRIWDEFDGYTLQITPEMGDWYLKQLRDDEFRRDNGEPYAGSTKTKNACCLLNFFRFRWDQRNGKAWEPFTLFEEDSGSRISDPITLEERPKIREAALEYKTVKSYNNCTPEERDRIRAELAQRLGKPKSDITPSDWEKVNTCWKWPSLLMVGLDIGPRPVELERMTVDWLVLSKPAIKVPRNDAAKNDRTWEVPITERTANALRRWLRQRDTDPKYDDTDHVWLTREGEPLSSGPLCRNLRSLMDEANLDYSDRHITWYSLRYSLGTYLSMTADSLEEVRRQMRHESIESTLNYIHPPEEDVRDNLNSIN
ncbi:site-specific integrase [Natrinema sp. SYSU A 869]|uniref:tyrosine-type recombinase/integrase n=1 Tax=Natrinema sp. SYSU A 869 TaxID=2871694 RepID=UPI001CA3924F|nr:site-specific integrase [Natrinema sp. SYSU A 869]